MKQLILTFCLSFFCLYQTKAQVLKNSNSHSVQRHENDHNNFYIGLNGVYFDKPNSDTNEHRYTVDNYIYTLNSVVEYEYEWKSTSGESRFIIREEDHDPGYSISKDEKNVVRHIQLLVDDAYDYFSNGDTSYTQTVISYNYLDNNGIKLDTVCSSFKKKYNIEDMHCSDELTGTVVNTKNIWMHPPRHFMFKILQLNPYPFIMNNKDLEEWSWNFTVGGSYLDSRWIKTDQETIDIEFNYLRQGTIIIPSIHGEIECDISSCNF